MRQCGETRLTRTHYDDDYDDDSIRTVFVRAEHSFFAFVVVSQIGQYCDLFLHTEDRKC